MNAGAATKNGNTSSGKWIHLPLVAPVIRILAGAATCCRAWVVRNGAYTAGLIVALSLIYGPVLATHVKHSMNPFVFNSNVRILIFPFFKYHDPGVFPNDYFGPYIRATLPVGYRALYTFGAFLWDPATISKVLPYILLTLTVGATAVVARRLSGYFGAFLGAALILSSWILDRVSGGLPRAFAFPTLAVAAAALVYGKPRLLATVVCVGAAFYPPAAIVGGIALAIWLLLLAKADRGEGADWCFLRRARLVILTAVFSALILLPTLIAGRAYGRLLSPRDIVEYPEVGPDGRFGVEDRPPFGTFPKAALEEARVFFRHPVGAPLSKTVQQWAKVRNKWTGNSNGDVIIEFIIGALLIGGIFVAARDSIGRRLLLLGAAAWVGHLVARSLAPYAPYLYFPYRYIEYPVPILLVLLIPAAGAAIGSQISHCRFVAVAREVGVIAMAVMVLLPFAGRGGPRVGLQIEITPQQRGLYTFLEQLPKDVLIAGWPDDLDNVPYVCRRQAFLTSELHIPFYKRYTDEMRRRMRAIIAAYFATDRTPLERLRDQFGVTHLIFEQNALEKPPDYFEPFSGWIQKAFNDGRRNGFEIPRQLETATVFSDGTLIVLDLHRLSESR